MECKSSFLFLWEKRKKPQKENSNRSFRSLLNNQHVSGAALRREAFPTNFCQRKQIEKPQLQCGKVVECSPKELRIVRGKFSHFMSVCVCVCVCQSMSFASTYLLCNKSFQHFAAAR